MNESRFPALWLGLPLCTVWLQLYGVFVSPLAFSTILVGYSVHVVLPSRTSTSSTIYILLILYTDQNELDSYFYFTSQDTKCFQGLIPLIVFPELLVIPSDSLAGDRDEVYVQFTKWGIDYGKYPREQSLTEDEQHVQPTACVCLSGEILFYCGSMWNTRT